MDRWVGIGALIVAATILLTAAYRSKPKTPIIDSRFAQVQVWTGGEPKVIALPIRYSNGVFLVTLDIGGNKIDAVVDTGSQRLVVASHTCAGCNGGSIPPPPRGRRAHPASPVRLFYGTQNETVEWGVYDVKTYGVDITSPMRPPGGVVEATVGVIYPKIDVAVTMERTGSSNYNIIGLSMPNKTSAHPSVLEMFMGPLQQLSFTVVIWCHVGWLVFGPPPQQYGFNYVPFLRDPVARGFFYQFYVIEAESLWYGEAQISGPLYVMIDTGSNMLSLPAASMQKAQSAGLGKKSHDSLVVKMKTTEGNTAVMSFPHGVYTWDDGTLLVEEEPPNSQIDRPLAVIGSLFMQNFAMHFDVANARIGIAEL